MLRRVTVLILAVLSLSLVALPARAAEPEPLTLVSHSIEVLPPFAPATSCDYGSELNCGLVAVTGTFSGLAGRTIEADVYPSAELTGTVKVLRTYGCQSASGRHLRRYDRQVREVAPLATRRSSGIDFVEGKDVAEATTFAFLQDAQPGNCPTGTQAMTYSIKAWGARLKVVSYVAAVPDASYSAPGRDHWRGAVPTPTAPTV